MSGRRGRRPGAPDTRATILAAARARFAEAGHAGASVRAIAADAGVDPALVHHYFGSKDDLFVAALELPVDPREVAAAVAAGGVDGAGERLMRAFVEVWEDPVRRAPLVALLRGGFDPAGRRLAGRGLFPAIAQSLGQALDLDQPERRVSLVVSQVLGLALTRYVLELEEVVALAPDELVAVYAPTMQRYLTGDLPTR